MAAIPPISPSLLLIPLLLFAALLRFHDLDLQSLWFDELMTWTRSNFDTLPDVMDSILADVWTPGYSLWMWAWMKAVGNSEFLLRYPAALAGVASVAAIFALGRRLTGDARVGIFAATLTAALHVTVYYSQEARPYSALILYTILSTYCWLRLMQTIARDEPLPLALVAGYAISLLAVLYLNYFGLMLLGLHGLCAGLWHLRQPRRWPKYLLMFGVVALGYAPWIPETLNDLGRGSYYLAAPKSYVYEGLTYLHFLFNARPPWVNTALIVIAAVLIAEGVRAARGGKVRWGTWALLIGWLVLPFTITYAYSSLASKSVLVDRYLLIAFPAWALLLAWTITRLPVPRPLPALITLAMTMLALNNLMYGWEYYHRVTKAQFREAAAAVVAHSADLPERPAIVGFTGHFGTQTHFDYYFEQMGSDLRVDLGAGTAEDIPLVEELIGGPDRPRYLWLVTAFNAPSPELVARLDADYRVVLDEPLFRAEVWLFEADGGG